MSIEARVSIKSIDQHSPQEKKKKWKLGTVYPRPNAVALMESNRKSKSNAGFSVHAALLIDAEIK